NSALSENDLIKLSWLSNCPREHPYTLVNAADSRLKSTFVCPRAAMVTPWSTNADESTQTTGISGIVRIEEFREVGEDFRGFDPMLSQRYTSLGQDIYTIHIKPEPVLEVEDIDAYNQKEGLALSQEEVDYLHGLSEKLGRRLT